MAFNKIGARIGGWLSGAAVDPVQLTSPAFFANPFPTYDALRQKSPVAEVKTGGYLLTAAHDIEAALHDPLLGNAPSRFSAIASSKRSISTSADVAANIPPLLDKPRHIDIRRALSSGFYQTLAGCDEWLPPMAQAQLSALSNESHFDVALDFARPFAQTAMARFVGLPDNQYAIARASDAMFRLFAPISGRAALQQTDAALQDARDYVMQVIAGGSFGTDSLIAHLIPQLALQEACDNALLILADGIENIEASVASFFVVMALNPETWNLVTSGHISVSLAVKEVLRLESPAQIIPRVARSDHELHGVAIKSGTPIFLALGSANRDPDVYPQPQQFDPTHDPKASLVFGRGRHSCIGAQLGLMLIETAVATLIAHKATPRIDPKKIAYAHRFGHRWPLGVMVST